MLVKAQNEVELKEDLIGIKKNENADFETAISATGFGKFNVFLLFATLPTCWASIFQLTTISYVFPNAQCDLSLSLEDKGLLSAVTFAGMMFSAFLWGFMYDTYGRRNLLKIGFFLDALLVILSSFSQNIGHLMVTKFLGGFIISGPFAALATYFSEMHDTKNRPRVPLVMGVSYALGGIYLPFLASLILPMENRWYVTENIVLHPWGIFLLINSIPSILSGSIFCFLPESPKFLMSMGRNEEAIEVFKNIYSWNTGRKTSSYPIKDLIMERTKNSENTNRFRQILPLFKGKLLKSFILVCFLQMFMTTSFYTLRIWMPQLFQAINDYKFFNNGTSSNLCDMLRVLNRGKTTKDCFVNFDNFEVYMNSMIVSLVTMIGYLIAGSLVNLLGQNKLLGIISFISGCSALGIYFSPNETAATIFIAACSSSASIGVNACIVVIVNLFPTTLRTITLSLTMIFGRIAVMMGNIIFPFLLEIGCFSPFLALAFLGFACSTACMLLPKKNVNFT
ncbi:synaptic vesicle glycoprotein 2B-like [Coccinella septempunctata]|uniref:synaptic vesicle glycoprotein 2B-like n=1 Tax=Coccinella septempunctata TaxID=41139 RepID=UPI001D092C5E|nr:synaptic vesicle glycoprotein 2B-like [Coccinella septempunctata]